MITIDNRHIQCKSAMTLDQAMAALDEPEIYAVVRLNGKLVSRPNFSRTFVYDGDVVEPLPLIAGG